MNSARKAMIDSQLRPQGVSDRPLLDAFAKVPREDYLSEALKSLAYRDRGVVLGEGRETMAPSALGLLLQKLDVKRGETVLVLGPGADYAAALIAHLGGEATAVMAEAGVAQAPERAFFAKGAPEAGHANGAPYDKMLIVGAVETLPDTLVEQLAEGGHVATGLVDGVTRLAWGRREGARVSLTAFQDAGMQKLAGFAKPKAFSF